MSMFSGITIALREDNGFELNMADVRMEFSESFQVLNSTAIEFDQWCAALDRLEQLNRSIEQHDGRADKSLIAFLNQNNDLADALGIDLSFENWDAEAVGTEIRQGYSMAMEGIWESIKDFFISIWNGIKNFFKNFFGMFKSAEDRFSNIVNNPKVAEKIKALQNQAANGTKAADANAANNNQAAQANNTPAPAQQPAAAQQPANQQPAAAPANQQAAAPKPAAQNAPAKKPVQVSNEQAKLVEGNVPANKKVIIKSDSIAKKIDDFGKYFSACEPLFNCKSVEEIVKVNIKPLADADLNNFKSIPSSDILLVDDVFAAAIKEEGGFSLVDWSNLFLEEIKKLRANFDKATKCQGMFEAIIKEAEQKAQAAGANVQGVDGAKEKIKCVIQCVSILGKMISWLETISKDYDNLAKKIQEINDIDDIEIDWAH